MSADKSFFERAKLTKHPAMQADYNFTKIIPFAKSQFTHSSSTYKR